MPAMCHSRTHAPEQTAFLFDHFIGAGKHRQRHVKAERFDGFAIEDYFEFGWDRVLNGDILNISAQLPINSVELSATKPARCEELLKSGIGG
jgi:hypothetical protein